MEDKQTLSCLEENSRNTQVKPRDPVDSSEGKLRYILGLKPLISDTKKLFHNVHEKISTFGERKESIFFEKELRDIKECQHKVQNFLVYAALKNYPYRLRELSDLAKSLFQSGNVENLKIILPVEGDISSTTAKGVEHCWLKVNEIYFSALYFILHQSEKLRKNIEEIVNTKDAPDLKKMDMILDTINKEFQDGIAKLKKHSKMELKTDETYVNSYLQENSNDYVNFKEIMELNPNEFFKSFFNQVKNERINKKVKEILKGQNRSIKEIDEIIEYLHREENDDHILVLNSFIDVDTIFKTVVIELTNRFPLEAQAKIPESNENSKVKSSDRMYRLLSEKSTMSISRKTVNEPDRTDLLQKINLSNFLKDTTRVCLTIGGMLVGSAVLPVLGTVIGGVIGDKALPAAASIFSWFTTKT